MVKKTGAIKGKKPIFKDGEGSIKVAIFKNKNARGTIYPVICVTAMRFPFKYCQKIYLSQNEVGRMIEVLKRIPKIEIKQKEKKKKDEE